VIKKSERGRYEVISLQRRFLEENKLQVQKLGDEFVWLDTNTVENLLRASIYIQKNKQR
jgi:glucose-1-phosphate thymidylyltransferase